MSKYDKIGTVNVYKKRKSSIGGWIIAAIILIGILAIAGGS